MLTMEEDTARIYREGLMDLTGEFGFERTEKAVRSAITHCKFFPTLAEIRGLVPAESKTRVAYDDNCPHCHGTGWKRELQGVRRCMCRHLVEVQA